MRRSAVIGALCQTPRRGAMVRTARSGTRWEGDAELTSVKPSSSSSFYSCWKPLRSSDLVTQSAKTVGGRNCSAAIAAQPDFVRSTYRRFTLKAGARLSPPPLSAIMVGGRALTIALLRRAISSARRAMGSNYPCNCRHHARRSSARKVGPNTQQVPDVRVRLRAALAEGSWCGVIKLPVGQHGEDGRAMRAITNARLVRFQGAKR